METEKPEMEKTETLSEVLDRAMNRSREIIKSLQELRERENKKYIFSSFKSNLITLCSILKVV
jgi:hypothetical protein